MVHEGHHDLFVVLQVVFDELVELGLPGLPLLHLFLLLHRHLAIFLGFLLDTFEGGEFPLDIEYFPDSFFLLVLHKANPGLNRLK